jgi:AP-3 complex subunit mu
LFDPTTKTLKWHVSNVFSHPDGICCFNLCIQIGKLNTQKHTQIKGSITLQSGSGPPDSNPTTEVHFKVPQVVVSGLKVNRLDLYGEKYKPFKGVKYATKAGKFQVRA